MALALSVVVKGLGRMLVGAVVGGLLVKSKGRVVSGDRWQESANTSLERTERDAFCFVFTSLQPLNFDVGRLFKMREFISGARKT
jgi:hypothetical protein